MRSSTWSRSSSKINRQLVGDVVVNSNSEEVFLEEAIGEEVLVVHGEDVGVDEDRSCSDCQFYVRWTIKTRIESIEASLGGRQQEDQVEGSWMSWSLDIHWNIRTASGNSLGSTNNQSAFK